jgi:hypothetical protein
MRDYLLEHSGSLVSEFSLGTVTLDTDRGEARGWTRHGAPLKRASRAESSVAVPPMDESR